MEETYLFIANSGDNTVSKVSATECKEICTYDVEKNPSRTAVSLDKVVWVGNRDSNTVSKLNGSNCEVINKSIPVGKGPRAMVVDERGHLWVGNYVDN
ncbi:unnamed protein product, partial [marine sediment metagenome]